MSKAKTKSKSKPAKKPVHKTFHKQAAPAVTPPVIQETIPQTTQPANETVITPKIQPDPVTEPTNPQPQQTEENATPLAPVITPSQTDTSAPEIVDETPTTPDTKSTYTDTTVPTLTPAPEEPENPAPPAESLLEDPNESKTKKPLIFALIIIVLITASISAYYLYVKKIKTASDKPQSTPTTQTTESQQVASPQVLNKADWTLEILNGSAKKGAAAALADKLTAKGYQVITTGNAPQDVAVSQVFFADSVNGQAELFLTDIKDELPNPTNAGSLNDSTASARIIIGAE